MFKCNAKLSTPELSHQTCKGWEEGVWPHQMQITSSMGGIDSIHFSLSLGYDWRHQDMTPVLSKVIKILWAEISLWKSGEKVKWPFTLKGNYFFTACEKITFLQDFHRVIVSKAFCVASFLNHWQDTYRQYSSVCLLPNPLNSWAEAPHDQRFWEADPKRDRLNKWFNKCESFKGLSYCLLFSYVNPSKDPFAVHDKLPSFSVLSEPLKGPSCLILAHHSFWRRF